MKAKRRFQRFNRTDGGVTLKRTPIQAFMAGQAETVEERHAREREVFRRGRRYPINDGQWQALAGYLKERGLDNFTIDRPRGARYLQGCEWLVWTTSGQKVYVTVTHPVDGGPVRAVEVGGFDTELPEPMR